MKKLKLIPLMLAAMMSMTACTGNDLVSKLIGAPKYNAKVVEVYRDKEDTTNLLRVTLDKTTLYNYYIDVADITEKQDYMTVHYEKDEKHKWTIVVNEKDKEVTNHGYVFVHWGKITAEEATTSSDYISSEVAE